MSARNFEGSPGGSHQQGPEARGHDSATLEEQLRALGLVLVNEERVARFPAHFTERQFDSVDRIRTVTTSPNGNRLEQPTREVIAALQGHDPRIDAVHTPQGAPVSFIWDELGSRLDEDFAGRNVVGLRTVEASLDGLVTDGTHDTHDIRDILRVGDIKLRPGVNVAGFWPGQNYDNPFRVHHRAQQYGSQTDFYRAYEVGSDVEGVDRIFPVALVYDLDLMGGGTGGHYGRALPTAEDERSRIILKAYVLDTEVGI